MITLSAHTNALVLTGLLGIIVKLTYVIQTRVRTMANVMAFKIPFHAHAPLDLLEISVILTSMNVKSIPAKMTELVTTQAVLINVHVMMGLSEETVRLTCVIQILVRITVHAMALIKTTLVHVLLDLLDMTVTVTLTNAIVVLV